MKSTDASHRFRVSFLRMMLLFICCMPVFATLHAKKPVRKDVDKVELRQMPQKDLDAYRASPAFTYSHPPAVNRNLWDSILSWLWQKWNDLTQYRGIREGLKVLQWVLPIALLLYAVLRMMGMEKAMLWVKGDKGNMRAFDLMSENIHEIDFDTEIAAAEVDGRYRDATRLHYLQSLRLLSTKGIIQWARNKTNIDYTRDMKGTPMADGFGDVTRIFEYVWYGELPISAVEYRKVSERFADFNKTAGA